MPLDREPSTTSVIDVLDHALDKGIVIDAWVRASVAGIDLRAIQARVVVASVATYTPAERGPQTLEEQLHRFRAQMAKNR
jgi:gas vesicle protein GvpA/GvpJ/GvpM family